MRSGNQGLALFGAIVFGLLGTDAFSQSDFDVSVSYVNQKVNGTSGWQYHDSGDELSVGVKVDITNNSGQNKVFKVKFVWTDANGAFDPEFSEAEFTVNAEQQYSNTWPQAMETRDPEAYYTRLQVLVTDVTRTEVFSDSAMTWFLVEEPGGGGGGG